MLMPYLGAVKAYLYYPIFKLCGPGVAAVRLHVIQLGLVALIFTYVLVRQTLGPCTALEGVVLLASDPTFIFMPKTDWGPIAMMIALKVSSLYFVFCWLNQGESLWLGVACFLTGVGVFDKVIFVWYVVALAAALPLCFLRFSASFLSVQNAEEYQDIGLHSSKGRRNLLFYLGSSLPHHE